MKLNLDALKTEIESYLRENGFVIFHGYSRRLDDVPEVDWDSGRYPDYKAFLDTARSLKVKLIVFHHHDFEPSLVESALEDLEESGLDYEEQRAYETRLRELSVYEGFTCAIELSFDWNETLYMFELQTEWYRELNGILEELHLGLEAAPDDEGEDPLGGYYSKN
jgi:hypothetical protein